MSHQSDVYDMYLNSETALRIFLILSLTNFL